MLKISTNKIMMIVIWEMINMTEVSTAMIDRILNLTMKMMINMIMQTKDKMTIINSLVREIIKIIRTRISIRKTVNRMISMMNRIRMIRLIMIRNSMKITMITMMSMILMIRGQIVAAEMVKLVPRMQEINTNTHLLKVLILLINNTMMDNIIILE
jgi:hypothetical protein